MKEIIKEIAKKHAERVEEITVEQFETCLVEAIKSGDFMRHIKQVYPKINKDLVLVDESLYGMTYVPFREKIYLEKKINELKGAIDFARNNFYLPQDVYDKFNSVYS